MISQYLAAYRSILREIRKSAVRRSSSAERCVRETFEKHIHANGKANTTILHRDVNNAVTFLRSQRMYKMLLDRYNPLHDMTQEQRVQATARRVGLNVPIERENKS